MTSASCSMAPDSRRSESFGRAFSRFSTSRLSWLIAMTGTSSSRASPFSDRLMYEISCWRLSTLRTLPIASMSCR